MIHYHGFPIFPEVAAVRAVRSGHAFVPFARKQGFRTVLEVAQSFAVDNSAFSAWRSGEPIEDWEPFYAWISEIHRYPAFDFAVVPDIVGGDEAANDALLAAWPWRDCAPWLGAPVWHLDESLARLERLALAWPRVCLGSAGEFATVGTPRWFNRMAEAMAVVCDRDGRPMCKLHGLRMLAPDVYRYFPFASADSTNVARSVALDTRWTGSYAPASREARAQIVRERIEAFQAPTLWRREFAPIQTDLLL